jgi:hypothetical protein
MSLLIESPWLALSPACLFLVLYLVAGRKVVLAAALIWLAYAIYEYAMYRRWLCTGECDIRVDLLLLYPGLILVSIIAGVSAIRAIMQRRTPE